MVRRALRPVGQSLWAACRSFSGLLRRSSFGYEGWKGGLKATESSAIHIRMPRAGARGASLSRIQHSDLLHRIIFDVAGSQGGPFNERGRGNQAIRQFQPTTRGSLFETPSDFGNLVRHGNDHESIEKRSSPGLFFRPHPCIQLCDRDDRTARDETIRNILKKRSGSFSTSDHIDENICAGTILVTGCPTVSGGKTFESSGQTDECL